MKASDMPAGALRARAVKPRWGGIVLVCAKCVRKHDEGKAIHRVLKTEARRAAAAAGKRKIRVIKTACLGLCPKRAIVVGSPATLAEGDVLLVRTESEMAAALPRLVPGTRARPAALPPCRPAEA